MLKHSTGLAWAFAVSAAALMVSTPVANADPPGPSCAPDDQACQDQQRQQQGAGIANQVIDQTQQGMNQLAPKSNGSLGIMVLKDGVPWCMPLDRPLPPGAVVTGIGPNGQTSYC